MDPPSERKILVTDHFPNYLGVILSHYCPAFLAGRSEEEIHSFLNEESSSLDNGSHNCFFGPVGLSIFVQQLKIPHFPSTVVATGIASIVIAHIFQIISPPSFFPITTNYLFIYKLK